MEAVSEHRDEMSYNHSIFSHFTATLVNVSGKEVRRAITYKDVYDPFNSKTNTKINQHTKEGKEKIKEAIRQMDANL